MSNLRPTIPNPAGTLVSHQSTLLALKEAVEQLFGLRGVADAAVTVGGLVGGAGIMTVPGDAYGSVTVADAAGALFFPVRKFGAVGDGSQDDYPAIQAAINAASVRGGIVLFEALSYRITKTLFCNSRAVALQGAGRNTFGVNFGTNILWDGALTGDWVHFSGDSCQISDIEFRTTLAVTGGSAVNLARTSIAGGRTRVARVSIRGAYNGVSIHGFPATTCEDVFVDSFVGRYGFRFFGDAVYRTDNAYFYRCTAACATSNAVANSAGMLMEGECASVFCIDCYWRASVYGFHMRSSGGGLDPIFCRAMRCAVENCKAHGYYLESGSFFVLRDSYVGINGLTAVGAGCGIYIDSLFTGGVVLSANDIRANGQHGVYIANCPASVQITECQIAANGQNTANTYAGIKVADGKVRFQIRGGFVGGDLFMVYVVGLHKYNIEVGAGCNYYIITGVDMRGGLTAALLDSGGPNKVVANNLT